MCFAFALFEAAEVEHWRSALLLLLLGGLAQVVGPDEVQVVEGVHELLHRYVFAAYVGLVFGSVGAARVALALVRADAHHQAVAPHEGEQCARHDGENDPQEVAVVEHHVGRSYVLDRYVVEAVPVPVVWPFGIWIVLERRVPVRPALPLWILLIEPLVAVAVAVVRVVYAVATAPVRPDLPSPAAVVGAIDVVGFVLV